MGNIIIGLIFVAGGASGEMVLKGTESPGALVVVGGLMVVYGCFQTFGKKA